MTAWNPGGMARGAGANAAAHARLRERAADLDAREVLNGEGEWQEVALLLRDVPLRRAVALGRDCAQAAVLWGTGRRAALVWLAGGTVRPERRWVQTLLAPSAGPGYTSRP